MYKIAETVNISLYYNVPVVLECFQSLVSTNFIATTSTIIPTSSTTSA